MTYITGSPYFLRVIVLLYIELLTSHLILELAGTLYYHVKVQNIVGIRQQILYSNII